MILLSSAQVEMKKVEPEPDDLLEESWFFGNLPHRKIRKPTRCYSDHCPWPEANGSGSFHPNLNRMPSTADRENLSHSTLLRTSTLPTCMGGEDSYDHESDFALSKLIRQASLNDSSFSRPKKSNNLLRTTTLPSCTGREEDCGQQSDFAMGRLIRQASLKSVKQTCSIPRQRLGKPETINRMLYKGKRRKSPSNERENRKGPSDVETKEVQGFRELGFTFDKQDLSPGAVSILPGLKEGDQVDSVDEDKVRSTSPAIPNWVEKGSAQDIKAQIKFWARAVASNVR